MSKGGALILWMWQNTVTDSDEDSESDNVSTSSFEQEACVSDSYVSHESDNDDSDSCNPGSVLTHTVCFNYIGVTLDSAYQHTLSTISVMGDVRKVTVKLCPELRNPVDSQAIAFVVSLDSKEHRIGYAVCEVLDDLHDAISRGDIVSVQFKWVKYRLDWYRTGSGYYCGVNICRKGHWSSVVQRYQSTR